MIQGLSIRRREKKERRWGLSYLRIGEKGAVLVSVDALILLEGQTIDILVRF